MPVQGKDSSFNNHERETDCKIEEVVRHWEMKVDSTKATCWAYVGKLKV